MLVPMRSRRVSRCESCRLPLVEPASRACLCAEFAPQNVRTRVVLVAHHREWRRSSNTGRLLLAALRGAGVVFRGVPGSVNSGGDAIRGCDKRLVLFPSDEARTLGPEDAAADLVLIVPDASWAQARRTMRRESLCKDAEPVRLPKRGVSRYRLRQAPRDGELSTFESVARALGILEGEGIERALLSVFDEFVARSLALRGRRSRNLTAPSVSDEVS
jgi:DTW domain-containing protein YfiP